MNEKINSAKIVSKWNDGAVFQGVGDKEVSSHFTYVKGEGYHVSTYLSDSLMTGESNEKIKFNQINFKE